MSEPLTWGRCTCEPDHCAYEDGDCPLCQLLGGTGLPCPRDELFGLGRELARLRRIEQAAREYEAESENTLAPDYGHRAQLRKRLFGALYAPAEGGTVNEGGSR